MAQNEASNPSEQPQPTPGAQPGEPPKSAAEALAAEALRAAQQAISGLKHPAPGGPKAAAAGAPATPASPQAQPAPFAPPALQPGPESTAAGAIDLLAGVDLHVKIELGRTRMYVEDVLRLRDGAVVELDKLAGDPVDVYVNDRPVARGEVLILNDNFCVRINEILTPVSQGA